MKNINDIIKIHKILYTDRLFDKTFYILCDTDLQKSLTLKITKKNFKNLLNKDNFCKLFTRLMVCMVYGDKRIKLGSFHKIKRKKKIKQIYKLISTLNEIEKKNFYLIYRSEIISVFSNINEKLEDLIIEIFKKETTNFINKEDQEIIYKIYKETYEKYFDKDNIKPENTYIQKVVAKDDIKNLRYTFLLFASYFSFGSNFEEPNLWN